MKQTLFEAEAVLSVDTSQMFTQLNQAAQQAKDQLQKAFGNITIPGVGGGGRGGGGGGASGWFGIEMMDLRRAKAAGQYEVVLQKIDGWLKSNNLTEKQNLQLQILQEATERKRLATIAQIVKKGELARKPKTKGSSDWFSLEKMELSRMQAAGQYKGILDQIDRLEQGAILNEKQLAQLKRIRQNVEFKHAKEISRVEREANTEESRRNREASRPGPRSSINPFGDEMASIRLLRNTHDYKTALAQINQLLGAQLSARQRLSAETLKANIIERQTLFASSGNVTPFQRRANAATQNASFAIQDFITVLSMGGGMTRALASASNNIAFMTSMMGTAGGAALGLGVTLAAVFVPALVQAALGIKELGTISQETEKRLKSLGDALEQTANRFDMYRDAKEMAKKGDVEGVLSAQATATSNLDREKQIYDRAIDESVGARGAVAAKTYEAMGALQGMLGSSLEEFQTAIASGKMGSGELRAMAAGPTANFITGASDALNALADEIDKINEPSKKSAAEIEKLNEQLKLLGEALLEAWKLPAEGWGRGGFDTDFEDFAAEQKKKASKEAEAIGKTMPAMQSIYERLFPKEAQIDKINKEYAAAFGANLPPEIQAARALEIAQVKNQRPEITGQMGGTEFAQQLTNMLLQKDPQTKLVDFASKQTGLQERMAKGIEESAARLKELEISPFQNN